MDSYEPRNWYWNVANRAGVVFSSAQAGYIDPSDSGYQTWIGNDNIASDILTDGELADVLARAGVGATAIYAAGWSDWGGVQPSDRVAVLLAAGLGITSTSNPGLNATYAIDDPARIRINSNIGYINSYNSFPNNAATFDWPDIDGNPHTFQQRQEYLDFGKAISDYAAAVHGWGLAGGTGAPPAQPVTIA